MTRLRRFLVFQAFLCWQGGFVFYAAVVVPTGTDLFGETEQGLVTQRVTHWLNLVGLAWHLLFAWDLFAERGRARFGCWLASLLILGGLVLLHDRLDSLIDLADRSVTDAKAFRPWHIAYLWGVTAQWALALVNAWLTLGVWGEQKPPAGRTAISVPPGRGV